MGRLLGLGVRGGQGGTKGTRGGTLGGLSSDKVRFLGLIGIRGGTSGLSIGAGGTAQEKRVLGDKHESALVQNVSPLSP